MEPTSKNIKTYDSYKFLEGYKTCESKQKKKDAEIKRITAELRFFGNLSEKPNFIQTIASFPVRNVTRSAMQTAHQVADTLSTVSGTISSTLSSFFSWGSSSSSSSAQSPDKPLPSQEENEEESLLSPLMEQGDDTTYCLSGLFGKAGSEDWTRAFITYETYAAELGTHLQELYETTDQLCDEMKSVKDLQKLEAGVSHCIEGLIAYDENKIAKTGKNHTEIDNDAEKNYPTLYPNIHKTLKDHIELFSKLQTKIRDKITPLAALKNEEIQKFTTEAQEIVIFEPVPLTEEEEFEEFVEQFHLVEREIPEEAEKILDEFLRLGAAVSEDEEASAKQVVAQEEDNTGWGVFVGNATNGLLNAVTPLVDKAMGLVVDKKDPWKTQHYEVRMEQVENIFSTRLAALEERADGLKELHRSSPKPSPKIEKLIDELSNELSNAIKSFNQKKPDPRAQKTEFVTHIRKARRLAREISVHNSVLLDPKERGEIATIEKELNSLCREWLTTPIMEPFYRDIVLYVASKGNPDIYRVMADPTTPMSEKIHKVLEGIRAADSQFKAPIANLTLAKISVILNTYDPLKFQNAPSKLYGLEYKNEEGKTHHVTEFRLGVPICPAEEIEIKEDRAIEGVTLAPEYVALLDDLIERNKEHKKKGEPPEKLLAVLHLDPHYYDIETNQIKTASALTEAKRREALWIKLHRDLSQHPDYKEVLSVAIVPMDGNWLKTDIQKRTEPWNLPELEKHLQTTLMDPKSPFLIPNMTREEKEKFVKGVIDQVSKQYFHHLTDKPLTKEQALAFVGLFSAQLIDAVTLKEKATYVQRNCKDAVDRTMAYAGSGMMDKYLRLGQLDDPEVQGKIMGTTCGPALGILKRELLEERQPILLAVTKHLDEMKAARIAPGKAPTYEGYTLEKIDIESRADLALKK
jgi:hypothetical protein